MTQSKQEAVSNDTHNLKSVREDLAAITLPSKKKEYRTATSSGVDHARTVASSLFWNSFYPSLVMVGVSSFGAEVSMVCNGWVVLTISEERKTSVWFR